VANTIEVRVNGRGVVCGNEEWEDHAVVARCVLCDREVEVVAAVDPPEQEAAKFACPTCLRQRLDAISVAKWRLRSPTEGGLPWGKVTG
jgi:hypothetical protein